MLQEYIKAAMSRAVCDYLDEDGVYFCYVRELRGAWAANESEAASRAELAEVLEDWITLGREHGNHIPVLDGIDLNAALMPPFGPISRQDLVRSLRRLGFEGPYQGRRHQHMRRNDSTLPSRIHIAATSALNYLHPFCGRRGSPAASGNH